MTIQQQNNVTKCMAKTMTMMCMTWAIIVIGIFLWKYNVVINFFVKVLQGHVNKITNDAMSKAKNTVKFYFLKINVFMRNCRNFK